MKGTNCRTKVLSIALAMVSLGACANDDLLAGTTLLPDSGAPERPSRDAEVDVPVSSPLPGRDGAALPGRDGAATSGEAPESLPSTGADADVTDASPGPPVSRALDLLLMIDNSPGMEQEQLYLMANMATLLEPLQGLDLHIGVVDSDMGAGNLPCNFSNPLGDWGLLWGNPDPTESDASLANVTSRAENPDRNGCGLHKGARWIEHLGSTGARNYSGNLPEVLGCLANVGAQGCGFEHQLRAIEVALTGQPVNAGFLRPEAALGVVMLTDEDDCSAPQDTDMFNIPGLSGETAPLRCAARGHVCNAQPIPYYDPATGFSPPSETALGVGFETPLSQCAPRTDAGNPLLPLQMFIDRVKALKKNPDQDIFVAGIVGWPLPSNEATAEYKVGKDPNPYTPALAGLWDLLPVCETYSLGKAYPALRLKAFIDAFGNHGVTYSLCTGYSTETLRNLGAKLSQLASAH